MGKAIKEIDYQKSKSFWDKRADIYGKSDDVLATTLQDELPAISAYRDYTEKKHLQRVFHLRQEMDVLDLGVGSGRWIPFFAKKVKSITCVDFSEKLLNIARKNVTRRNLMNVSFEKADILHYEPTQRFDLIFISGVLMYVNDRDLTALVSRCSSWLKEEGSIVVREGVNYKEHIVFADEYCPELQCTYSVIWRKPKEYLRFFQEYFRLKYCNDAFPFLMPVFFYKRFVPKKIWKNGLLQRLLLWALYAQSLIDPVFLDLKFLMRWYHKWLQKEKMAVTAQLYVFCKKNPTKDEFHFGGENVAVLAKKIPTPFYLFSTDEIERNFEEFMSGFPQGLKPRLYYSIKTNYERAIVEYMRKTAMGAEVASELDLAVARAAGYRPEDIIVDGYYKNDAFLAALFENGFKTINIESLEEIERIHLCAKKFQRVVEVGLRINIDLGPGDWRNYITDRKQKSFGFHMSEVYLIARKVREFPFLKMTSLMTHTSRSFMRPKDYVRMLHVLFDLAYDLKKEGVSIEAINLGGGIPEKGFYKGSLCDFSRTINSAYNVLADKTQLRPQLIFELGKSLVGSAGILVGTALRCSEKEIIVDISRSDFGFAFPFRKRRVLNASKFTSSVCGHYMICSSNLEKYDIISRNVKVPYVSPGDIIVLCGVGAYSLPLATQFIRPRSAVYILHKNTIQQIRRAETVEDLLSLQQKINYDV